MLSFFEFFPMGCSHTSYFSFFLQADLVSVSEPRSPRQLATVKLVAFPPLPRPFLVTSLSIPPHPNIPFGMTADVSVRPFFPPPLATRSKGFEPRLVVLFFLRFRPNPFSDNSWTQLRLVRHAYGHIRPISSFSTPFSFFPRPPHS